MQRILRRDSFEEMGLLNGPIAHTLTTLELCEGASDLDEVLLYSARRCDDHVHHPVLCLDSQEGDAVLSHFDLHQRAASDKEHCNIAHWAITFGSIALGNC